MFDAPGWNKYSWFLIYILIIDLLLRGNTSISLFQLQTVIEMYTYIHASKRFQKIDTSIEPKRRWAVITRLSKYEFCIVGGKYHFFLCICWFAMISVYLFWGRKICYLFQVARQTFCICLIDDADEYILEILFLYTLMTIIMIIVWLPSFLLQ